MASDAPGFAHRIAVIARKNDRGQASERRRMGALAEDALLLIELVAVAGRQRLHHRIVGIARLDQHQSRLLGAAGAAGDLMQQLERAFARAQIAVRAAEIGIDHADQRQLRKMMALGDDLRADQHVDLALRHGADRGLRFLRAMHRVARGDGHARLGKQAREFLRHALDAGTAGDEAALARRTRGHFGGVGVS